LNARRARVDRARTIWQLEDALMRKHRRPLASGPVWAVSLLIIVGGAGSVWAQAPTRDMLLNAFDELRVKAEREGLYDPGSYRNISIRGQSGRVPIEVYTGQVREKLDQFEGVRIVDGGRPRDVKVLIKVWAVPIANGRLTRTKVNLGKYLWRPSERMAFFIETALPMQLAFYQVREGPNGEEVGRDQVLPSPRFPDANRTIRPNRVYRLPVDFELDPDTKDEIMAITAVVSGSGPDLPPKDLLSLNNIDPDHAVFGRYNAALNRVAEEARLSVRFKATAASDPGANPQDLDPDGQVETMGDANKVATIAYGEKNFGELRIRLRKRRD
jgi:hypothetical protein